MSPANLLFILSDEHNPRVLGAAGHPMIKTPNLDRIAASGVRFTSAYCNSPICVPSRASLATGRYVHEIRMWDNAIAYDGSLPSWHHRLRDAGHEVTSIGKLHFRSAQDDNGFTEEIMPLHIVDAIGDPLGWLRDPLPVREAALRLAGDAGSGDSHYQQYDDKITAAAIDWLKQRTARRPAKPWVLFVSLICPHFPLIARPEWFGLYPLDQVPEPALYAAHERPDHPYVAAIRECMVYDKAFTAEKRRTAIAAYFGLVSFVDHNVGKLLDALAATGLRAITATTSEPMASGANRRCTRSQPACRCCTPGQRCPRVSSAESRCLWSNASQRSLRVLGCRPAGMPRSRPGTRLGRSRRAMRGGTAPRR